MRFKMVPATTHHRTLVGQEAWVRFASNGDVHKPIIDSVIVRPYAPISLKKGRQVLAYTGS